MIWRLCLLLTVNLFAIPLYAETPVPSDVRYYLEDIYGADQADWPKLLYSQDLNHDGLPDWIARQDKCQPDLSCQADVFLCKRGTAPNCDEYCYSGSGLLHKLSKRITDLKCESTC